MKTIKTIFILFAISGVAMAQSYNVSVLTATYKALSNPISLTNGNTWNDKLIARIPVSNFNFSLFDVSLKKLEVNCGQGNLSINNYAAMVYAFYSNSGSALLTDRYPSLSKHSEISYQYEGAIGSQILKIEFNDVGLKNDIEPRQNYLNFQVWLYETTNELEIHFGPNKIETSLYRGPYSSDTGPTIGVMNYKGASEELTTKGNANNPIISTKYDNIDGTPSDGIVYKFLLKSTGVKEEFQNNMVNAFPNPSSGIFNFIIGNNNKNTFNESYTINVFNLLGESVYQKTINNNTILVDLSTELEGVYLYYLNDAHNKLVRKGKLIIE